MQWFRYYSEALDDPKVQLLPDKLFRAWVNILSLANEGEPRGRLPGVQHVAYALRIKEDVAQRHLDELVARGLLDAEGGVLVPHNWDGRQPLSDDARHRMNTYRRRTHAELIEEKNRTSSEHVQNNGRTRYELTHPVEEERKKEEEEERDESSPRKRVDSLFLTELSIEYAERFHETPAEVRERIDRAMNGKAYRGYRDKRKGLRGWLNSALKDRREHSNGKVREASTRTALAEERRGNIHHGPPITAEEEAELERFYAEGET